MSHHVSELKALLEQIPGLLDELSQDVWESIDHDDAKSLQSGVTFKQQYNDKADRLKKAAGEFVALIDQHLEVRTGDRDGNINLRIKKIDESSNLQRLEQFLSPTSSKDNT
jgi:hypothetical protein